MKGTPQEWGDWVVAGDMDSQLAFLSPDGGDVLEEVTLDSHTKAYPPAMAGGVLLVGGASTTAFRVSQA